MKYLLSILCLFVLSCDSGDTIDEQTILGIWEVSLIEECMYLENSQECSNLPDECRTLETYFNSYEPLPPVIEQSRTIDITNDYIIWTVSYEYINVDESSCVEVYSIPFLWDSNKEKCLIELFEGTFEVISIDNNSVCVLNNPNCDNIKCINGELSDNGNIISYNSLDLAYCSNEFGCETYECNDEYEDETHCVYSVLVRQ